MNECFDDTNKCHEQAYCTNNVGSYTCQCNQAFQGDGFTCQG